MRPQRVQKPVVSLASSKVHLLTAVLQLTDVQP